MGLKAWWEMMVRWGGVGWRVRAGDWDKMAHALQMGNSQFTEVILGVAGNSDIPNVTIKFPN
jgi:hypothetical protein